jgi:YD repeat-containing protein
VHVFVERYDYRDRHGFIERYTLDADGRLQDVRLALRERWHLSYPQVFEGEGAVWMLPEAHHSGGLTLYRADALLETWQPAARIALDRVAVDATPLWHRDRWWLFYSPADTKTTRRSHLHVAWAARLEGPWHPHPGNPVRIDAASARPGGTAVQIGERILLPVQDCTRTYGGATRPLWISRLDETGFEAACGEPLSLPASAGRHRDGMHTLSACGDWTLLDVKYVDRTGRGWLYGLRRLLGPSA